MNPSKIWQQNNIIVNLYFDVSCFKLNIIFRKFAKNKLFIVLHMTNTNDLTRKNTLNFFRINKLNTLIFLK